eukprot:198397_1
MINQHAAGNSSVVESSAVVDEPVLVDAPSPVVDLAALDARWARRRREVQYQRVPVWVWKAAAFVGVLLLVAALVAALISFFTNSTMQYTKSLRAFTNDDSAGSKFTTNVKQLLANFANSPELVTYPHYGEGRENNPNPPTLQISPDVLTSEKPTRTIGGLCVPLSCSPNKHLTVKAMDFNTKWNVSNPRNFAFLNLMTIPSTG